MATVTYNCTGCVVIDRAVIDAYNILTSTEAYVESAESDRSAAEAARVLAEQGRVQQASDDHGIAQDDHRTAAADHGTAGDDHILAVADHGTAADDHVIAVADHGTAGDDHLASTSATSRANDAAAAAEHMVEIHQGPPGADGHDGQDGQDGTGITEIEQTVTSHANGGQNTVQIRTSDGNSYNVYIKNGSASNGLFPTSSALNTACPSPAVGDFAYVGSGFPADIYVCQTAGTWVDSVQDYDGDNVDLTDYAKQADLDQLELELDSHRIPVDDDGIFFVDNDNNIGFQYTEDGLDAAKLSDHFLSLVAGASNLLEQINVEEQGLFFVDSNHNIGVSITSTGLHAINMVEHLNF